MAIAFLSSRNRKFEGIANLRKRLAKLEETLAPVDLATYTNLLQECGSGRAISEGKRVHAHILQNGLLPDRFLGNLILSMYGKCGSLQDARYVFNSMIEKNVVTWNTMVSAYAQHGNLREVLILFKQMESENVTPNRMTFLSVINSCANTLTLTLSEGNLILEHVLKNGLESDTIVMNALVSMYDKCACLDKAIQMFDNILEKDVVSWNSIIAACVHHGSGRAALDLFKRMQQRGMTPNRVTFINILGVCLSPEDMEVGKTLHKHVLEQGLGQDLVVGSALVAMYGKCKSVVDARGVFDGLVMKNIITWNSMIGAYARSGYTSAAFELFERMETEGLKPDMITFLNVLRACCNPAVLSKGKQMHLIILEKGPFKDVSVENALVNMYGNCGSVADARAVFDKIHQRNVVSWSTMIGAYAELGHAKEALQLFHQMQIEGISPNKVTLLNVLNACGSEGNLLEGQLVHSQILQNGFHSDIVITTALVNMYGKCGTLETARMIFDTTPKRDVVLWNAMISTYAHHGLGKEALSLFRQMKNEGMVPDKVTFICILDACSSLGALADGRLLHSSILEHGLGGELVVSNALMTMYGACGSLEDAHKVFDCMPLKDLISWNAIIGAYANQGYKREALSLFEQLRKCGFNPDKVTLVSIFSLYGNAGDLDEAKSLHSTLLQGSLTDTMVGNSLINMYGKCGSVQDARKVFDALPEKDIVSWNAMLSAYIQDEAHCKDALRLFWQMEEGKVKPDKVTFGNVLNACSNLADLTEGIKVHDRASKYGMESDTFVGNALVNLYAKCGKLKTARVLFGNLYERDIVSWNAIIAAYAQHGQGEEAIQLFKLMQHEKMTPDKITFIAILSACSHAGLIDEGHRSFLSMYKDLGYAPTSQHYGSMIDLFGRAGQLSEAEELLSKMPCEPSSIVWMALLSACKNYGDLDRGRRAAEHAVRLDPLNDAPYVVLSNMYAAEGRWHDVTKIRGLMTAQGTKRVFGCSSIEVDV